MLTIKRATSDDPDFVGLVKFLDIDLADRDGNETYFYAQFNKIDLIDHVVIAHENGVPVGCGALKPFDDESVEIKRMYTTPEYRSKGIASSILAELEVWAKELGFSSCVLETGKRQPEAIALYEKAGYRRTENYGQYVGVENSVCFRKDLN